MPTVPSPTSSPTAFPTAPYRLPPLSAYTVTEHVPQRLWDWYDQHGNDLELCCEHDYDNLIVYVWSDLPAVALPPPGPFVPAFDPGVAARGWRIVWDRPPEHDD
jgi:hypothetical protein